MLSYFNGIFQIGYAENTGSFLGMGADLPGQVRFWIFVVGIGIFLCGLLVYLLFDRKQNIYSLVGLTVMLSGGLSNLYDRVVNNGAVIDFMNVGIGSLRTGIFNVADINIMLGMGIIFYGLLRSDDHSCARDWNK